jgi:anti-sigma B factor antagonist
MRSRRLIEVETGPTLPQAGRGDSAQTVDSQRAAVIGFRLFVKAPSARRNVAMKIVERQVGDVIILDLHGKILIGEGDDALREAVTKLVDGGKTRILLNLADVPYVDSAGLGEIVRCYTTVSKKSGKLKLLHLTKKIQDLLSITKLLTVFETFEDEAEAVKSFSS